MKNKFSLMAFSILVVMLCAFIPTTASAESLIDLQINQSGDLAASVEIFLIVTLLSFFPAIVICLTCYTKMVIVLSLTRQALGTATAPPNLVISGIALVLTMFVMAPVGQQMYNEAYLPFKAGEMSFEQTIETAEKPLKKYMVENADEDHLQMMAKIAGVEITTKEEVPFLVATTASLITQVHDAFGIGVIIMVAFVVIDMIVSATLMLLGMFMLPPTTISLPIKLITFLAAGGFELVIEILISGIKV